ncbi:hypothetical protein MMC25_007405 [Agyrium rufum]|nr:hypothetical protein [Agyrium rufum]
MEEPQSPQVTPGITCVYSEPFRRTHKRKRLQELEEETTALKRQLSSVPTTAHEDTLPDARPLYPHQEEQIILQPGPDEVTVERQEPLVSGIPTLPRTIEGLELAASIIDEYFHNYHHMLPILDPNVTTNTFYEHAPFLFWVIVSIGSRRYFRQPTLTQTLAMPVTQLALQSLIIRTKPIERMKGLILLINWPFPSGPFYRDPSFILSGPLLHLAMQCGLYAPSFSQDFSRTYLRLSEEESIRRAEMWAYVIITYQRTCSSYGQANLVSFEIYNEQPHFKSILEKLPKTLKCQVRISNIITRAHKALLDLGLLVMTLQQERTMDALLSGFNRDLDNLEDPLASGEDPTESIHHCTNRNAVWDRLYLAAARQDLTNMHFYKSSTTLDAQACMSIFNATTHLLEDVRDIDRTSNIRLVSGRFLLITVLLSLASLARVLKGPFAGFLDQSRGSDLYDYGSKFIRASSTQKFDFGEKAAAAVERIWTSKKVFRNPDGSVNITLRLRNRLSAGPWYDVTRCWKEEFIDLDYLTSAPGVEMETVIPSLATAGLRTANPPSVDPENAPSNMASDPLYLLDDGLWRTIEAGLNDDWDLAEPSLAWML